MSRGAQELLGSVRIEHAGKHPSSLQTTACLIVYTLSNFVFGMICSGLGPAIPWLSRNAGVKPEMLGWLPAAQSIMCIGSGLASGLMAKVPRPYHHELLCLLMLWLGGFFAILPMVSTSLAALVAAFGIQVLPRPWIGQMTNLLVSELYDASEDASAAQSFSQGGFAAGCVFMLLLEQAFRESYGTQMVFFAAGGLTFGAGLVFCALPRLSEKPPPGAVPPSSAVSELHFTLACNILAMMAVGVEVMCGTWLITVMEQHGFDTYTATNANMVFWMLFAASRLALAPYVCRTCKPSPSSVVIAGGAISAACCLPSLLAPTWLPAVVLAVGGVALGAGPSYAMTISMVKDRQGLTSVDSALFSIAASLGAGFMPFLMSRVLLVFGPNSYFSSLFLVSLSLAGGTHLLANLSTARQACCMDEDESTKSLTKAEEMYSRMELAELKEVQEEDVQREVPAIIWIYWEQGWQSAPLINRICAASWEKANPEASVRKISASDLPELIPDEIAEWPRIWRLPVTQRGDIVRLALLHRYGGVWADSTLFCTAPVMPWLKSLSSGEELFFVFDRSDSNKWPYDPFVKEDLLISSFFVVACRGRSITSTWLKYLKKELEGDTIRYFAIHDAFRRMLECEDSKRQLFQQAPKVSSRHQHIIEFELGFAAPATSNVTDALRRSLEKAPMMKLSSKILNEQFVTDLLRAEPSALSALFALNEPEEVQQIKEETPRPGAPDLVQLDKAEREIVQQVRANWKLSIPVPESQQR